MQYTVKIHINGTERIITADEGTGLLRLLQNNGFMTATPCAGKGTCGKCAVRVRGDLKEPEAKEKSLLGSGRLEKGCRLACYLHVASDLDVFPGEHAAGNIRKASIITEGKIRDIPLEPIVRKHYVELEPPSLNHQKADLEKAEEALELIKEAEAKSKAKTDAEARSKVEPEAESKADAEPKVEPEAESEAEPKAEPKAEAEAAKGAVSGSLSESTPESGIGAAPASSKSVYGSENLELLKAMPGVLKASGYKVTLVETDGRLAAVESGDTTGSICGIAVDIGTTTVAAYLFDLVSGMCVSTDSVLNPQRRYGADVISRIGHSMRSESNRAELQALIAECINGLASRMAKTAGIRTDDIYAAVLAGNTTMQHLLLGLDASGIAAAPFIPVTTALVRLPSKEIGLSINRFGEAVVFPGVSAYIGGDIVAGMLSSGIYENEGVSLFVDIGTNGEMVLGSREWLLACSTAAGPAFEGANIRNGMGGVTGAVDSVGQAPDFKYTTIGNAKAAGICGSGIVDAVAALLDAEILDETGRLPDSDEAEAAGLASERLVSLDGQRAFVLCGGDVHTDEGVQDEPIVLTQRDIREIQNAKAAIAAGIETLIREAGISVEDIEKVYLAGGFGSSLHIDTAVRIGLLPKALQSRVEAIGNASGAGAAEGLLSAASLRTSEKLSRRVKYIELSASAYFTEKYVENMLF